MKLYTVFTESHRPLFENYFLKTFPFEPRIELRVLFKPQICNAEFRSKGWKETMYYKVHCFKQAIQETKDGEYFMFSDPDIQFFRPFYDDVMQQAIGFDAAFQNDYGGGVNTGFFIMKSTKKTRAFINTVEGNLHNFEEEQECFNHLIFNFDKYESISHKVKMLSNDYWTYGEKACNFKNATEQFGTWDGRSDFNIPKNIIMHHGNWTKSFADKIKLMDLVRHKYNESIIV